MTSIFEGQPPQKKAFSNKNKGHLGFGCIYNIYIYLFKCPSYVILYTLNIQGPGPVFICIQKIR